MNEENNDGMGFLPENMPEQEPVKTELQYKALQLSGMYQNWFLDYASYVILERAVPEVIDGLKPVQRRILHAMRELDDGRYNKVANIIGHTMKYHPHGDASIGDALVQLGQKDLVIDCQGNWGNILTGDSAAAPRYIEARLSKFANEVIFNPKTTKWKRSYDGRNDEPVMLPVKFPLLLAQGVEGIAVGLASKILPHNFNELIDACIHVLKQEDFELFPDFATGGMADCSKYNDGLRGGRVRVRAKITQPDKRTLLISEIPFTTTTPSLIESILTANEKGKIKIRKIDDNTAENVEILVHLTPGVSPDQTIDALYAFTDCEVSLSPNACVIYNGKPAFIDVKEILRISTQSTLDLLKLELEIRLAELREDWHHYSLERIFIQNEIYLDIRKSTSFDDVIATIDKGLQPFASQLWQPITHEDIVRLTEIRIKRISAYNSFEADNKLRNIEEGIEEVKNHLAHLIDFAINYFVQIKKKYGPGRERKTELRSFDTIEAAAVAVANQKLYINRAEGFAGTGLKKDEYICDCSDIDDIIYFKPNGIFVVTKVSDKFFVGENILHIDVFRRNDERTIYNMIYQDGKLGPVFVKRFAVVGVTRDKEYDLTAGSPGSKVLYFTPNPNGEAEIVRILLRPKPKLKKLSFEFDFSTLAIKGRSSRGNTLSRHLVKSVTKKESGVSTLGARDIFYDEIVKRLNTDQRGLHLGAFMPDDRILAIMQSGHYRIYGNDLATHFDDDMSHISQYDDSMVVTALVYDEASQSIYLKRFQPELSDKKTSFIGEEPGNKLLAYSVDMLPRVQVEFVQDGKKPREGLIIEVSEFAEVKSHKAKGRKISVIPIKSVVFIEPTPWEPPVDEEEAENEDAKDLTPEAISEALENANKRPENGDGSTAVQLDLGF